MIPIDQTLLVERDGMGDCLRACVASILERPIGSVPLCDRRVNLMLDWLQREGFDTDLFTPTLHSTPDDVAFAVLCGPSPRNPNGGHSVVGRRGPGSPPTWEIAHDPHPSRSGLGGPPDTIITFWRHLVVKSIDCISCNGKGGIGAPQIGPAPVYGYRSCGQCNGSGKMLVPA